MQKFLIFRNDFEKFIKNAEDFLVNEYLDYAEFEAIDISKITKL